MCIICPENWGKTNVIGTILCFVPSISALALSDGGMFFSPWFFVILLIFPYVELGSLSNGKFFYSLMILTGILFSTVVELSLMFGLLGVQNAFSSFVVITAVLVLSFSVRVYVQRKIELES